MRNRTFALSALGFELTGAIVGTIIIAGYLEELIPSKGIWTASLIILAFIGWLMRALSLLKKLNSNEESLQKQLDNKE